MLCQTINQSKTNFPFSFHSKQLTQPEWPWWKKMILQLLTQKFLRWFLQNIWAIMAKIKLPRNHHGMVIFWIQLRRVHFLVNNFALIARTLSGIHLKLLILVPVINWKITECWHYLYKYSTDGSIQGCQKKPWPLQPRNMGQCVMKNCYMTWNFRENASLVSNLLAY